MGDSKHINPTSTAATDDSMPPEVSAIVRAMDEQKRQILDTEMKIGQVKNENEECKRKISDLEVRASGAARSEATRCNNFILTCWQSKITSLNDSNTQTGGNLDSLHKTIASLSSENRRLEGENKSYIDLMASYEKAEKTGARGESDGPTVKALRISVGRLEGQLEETSKESEEAKVSASEERRSDEH